MSDLYGDRRLIDRGELLRLLEGEAEDRAARAAALSISIGDPPLPMTPDQVAHEVTGLMREVHAIEALAEVIAMDTKHAPSIPDHWHYDFEHGWVTDAP